MKVLYEGVDIYPEISVRQCVHTMYAAGHVDELVLKANDVAGQWDKWDPQPGDRLEVEQGAARTGKMWIAMAQPQSGSMTLRATGVPLDAFDAASKSWEDVWLYQLCEEIAGRLGLVFEAYGVENQNYAYVEQKNISALKFLSQRCALEGAAFLVFDGRMVVYSISAREESVAEKAIYVEQGSNFAYEDMANRAYGRAEIGNGLYTGRHTADAANTRVLRRRIGVAISHQGEADRFAMNLLRAENSGLKRGCVWSEGPLYAFAPGGGAWLDTDGAARFNGKIFIEKLRHDYSAGKSKLEFRVPMEED